MEEDDDAGGDLMEDAIAGMSESTKAGDSSSFTPAKRNDDIGLLAWRLCSTPPDFTAAVPLADAIEAEISALSAMAFKAKLIGLLRFVPSEDDMLHAELRRRLLRQLRNNLRTICAPFLYDFNSATGVLSVLVSRITVPAKPLATRSASVDLVYCPLRGGYGVGDRVRMPDGRQGVVVVARDGQGNYGVMPSENNEPPTASDDGGMEMQGPMQGMGYPDG